MEYSLMTDRYELSMLQSFIESGKVNEPASFEVFTRKLPQGRRYGVFAGLGRLIPLIREFRFGVDELDFLSENGVVNDATRSYLRDFKFTGTIDAYREGEIFFPNSPVLTVTGTLGECILLETLILSVLNFDSAIATTAARMVSAAQGRPIIEMGSRRVNEDAAVAAARAAYIAGFDATSNLKAGYDYGIPTKGTAAHAFTLAHESELEAFEAQVKSHGSGTSLLVDTYNIQEGIRNAVKAAGPTLGAIRIDSGDLRAEAFWARALLDDLGARDTKIIVTSDLDEYVIKDLRDAPVDGYGVGTKLVSSAPMGFVYKLVEISGRPVAKKAKDKVSIGGRKVAFRIYNKAGEVEAEVFSSFHKPNIPSNARMLNQRVLDNVGMNRARVVHEQSKAELPEGEQAVWHGDFGPFLTCVPYEGE